MDQDSISIEDRLAIRRLKHEYCFRIDGGDYGEWASLFVEDGVFDPGEPIEGREALVSFAENVFDEQYENTAHVVTNPVIEVDGDEASARFYLHLLTVDSDGETGWMQARYDDEFVRVDGEWKAKSVVVNPLFEG